MTPKPSEVPIPPSVRAAAQSMMHAIHFDDEPNGGSEEVSESVTEHDLPAEVNPELATRQLLPKQAFGF